jgi:hypothetical protein
LAAILAGIQLYAPKEEAAPLVAERQEVLKLLVKFILNEAGTITDKLTSLMDSSFLFISNLEGHCAAENHEIDLAESLLDVGEIRRRAQQDFKNFCQMQSTNYNVAMPLFTHFWEGVIKNPYFDKLSLIYKELYIAVTKRKEHINRQLKK